MHDREAARAFAVDGHPRGRRQRRPRWLLGLGRPPAGPSPSEATEAMQVAPRAVARRGHPAIAAAVLTRSDRSPPTVGLPGRPGDTGEPRDDLPVALRAGPRRTAP